MNFNYITAGFDCSPASALRNLELREFALPFDWVVSNIKTLKACFETNFAHFHKDLVFNHNKSRLIDHYGFEFPHDYPLSQMKDFERQIGEGLFPEETGMVITDKWSDYHQIALDKYNRRIERFNKIVNDTKPIIVLSRYNTIDVLELEKVFIDSYKIKNIYFVNSSNEHYESDTIININTEKNNVWNDITLWKEGIDHIIKKHGL